MLKIRIAQLVLCCCNVINASKVVPLTTGNIWSWLQRTTNRNSHSLYWTPAVVTV